MPSKTTLSLPDLEQPKRYRLLASLIVPRPIAWISTQSSDGCCNVAPFSFFNVFGSKPPLVIATQGNRPDGTPKDTPANIMETGEFVINLVDEAMAAAMNDSAEAMPAGISEIKHLKLRTSEATEVNVPMLEDCPANLECKLIEVRNYGDNRLVVGEVKVVHIRSDLYDEATNTLSEDFQLIGKTGGNFYHKTNDPFEIERPS